MLTIRTQDLRTIIDHCRSGLPDEACGIVAGRNGVVEKVYCMANARSGPVSYEMEPEEQFRVLKDIRSSGRDLVGLFHSHPGGRAFPSSVDVEQAYWPGTMLPNYPEAVYLIVSLIDPATPEVRGFRIAEGAVSEEPLTVV